MARVIGAVTRNSNYEVSVKKPLDARSIVKTYADLTDRNNWVNSAGNPIVYNGMLVAVWLNTEDPTKNGVYFLHDSTVTKATQTPDVTKEANWHKLGGVNDLPGLSEQLNQMQAELDAVKEDIEDLQDSATVIKEKRSEFPQEGIAGKLYVATEEAKTYVWVNNDYLPVGDGGGDAEEIQIIHGGSASTN
jgi:hypothetical protein